MHSPILRLPVTTDNMEVNLYNEIIRIMIGQVISDFDCRWVLRVASFDMFDPSHMDAAAI